MHHSLRAACFVAAAMIGVVASGANAEEFHARFSGFNEVGALNAETGAILSNGRGTLESYCQMLVTDGIRRQRLELAM